MNKSLIRSVNRNWLGESTSRLLKCCLALAVVSPALLMNTHSSYAQSADFDEGAALATLAAHPNPRMHYRRLSSPLRRKDELWQGFQGLAQPETRRRVIANFEAEILEKSAAELQEAVAQGKLSYENISRFFIARIIDIESSNTQFLNAVIALNPGAVAAAQAADAQRQERVKAGEAIPADSLFGLPVLLKDNVGFEGLPTTAGAAALAENLTQDAFVTTRLKSNGVVILGKANLSEWAYFFCRGCPSGYSALGGQTLNPYGRFEFNTGGSSSGSGAAIAAGFAVAAVGSETAGSILSPASSNSLVGLKPTTGSLSRSGVVPIASTLDTLGPMGRNLADVVALFNAMAGYDQADRAMPLISADLRLVLREASIAGLRLGLPRALADDPLIAAAVATLEAAGAEIVPVEFSPPDLPQEVEFMGAEMVRDLPAYLDAWAPPAVPVASLAEIKAFNEQAASQRMPYGQALVDGMAAFEASFVGQPALMAERTEALRALVVGETGGYLERLFEDNSLDALVRINNSGASAGAFANFPALTMPVGYRDSGQPIGITLYAPSFQEQRLVDLGAVLEAAGSLRVPPSF